MTTMNTKHITQLKHLINQYGLEVVLLGVAAISSSKAEHIAASYSDYTLSGMWEDAASAISVVAVSSAVRNVSPEE